MATSIYKWNQVKLYYLHCKEQIVESINYHYMWEKTRLKLPLTTNKSTLSKTPFFSTLHSALHHRGFIHRIYVLHFLGSFREASGGSNMASIKPTLHLIPQHPEQEMSSLPFPQLNFFFTFLLTRELSNDIYLKYRCSDPVMLPCLEQSLWSGRWDA